jgi:pantoate--beta-alanine ligase
MRIVQTISELKPIVHKESINGSIGFVPTMGALHEGHLSLVEKCVKENDFTIVSIFVNPTQFNDKNDLARYPRDLEKDRDLLKTTGCNLIFAPSVGEMYPETDHRIFQFGVLEKVMEGAHRPGHFNGVAQIVTKFFDIVAPDKAYFGLKDFQQLAIIRRLVKDYNYPVEIVPCPIKREEDGLAMSSRNILIDKQTRNDVPRIYQVLQSVKSMYLSESLDAIVQFVHAEFNKQQNLELEYFEIVDDETLQPISSLPYELPCTSCIAVFAGKVRLIDNVQLNS